MTKLETILDAAMELSAQERLQLAFALVREYDGHPLEALAEAWAEDNLHMTKVNRGHAGIDGWLPNGRSVQIKLKKAGAHSDAQTYVKLSASTAAQADDLLIVFIDHETCKATRTVGPVAILNLRARSGRYYVHDILTILHVGQRSGKQ